MTTDRLPDKTQSQDIPFRTQSRTSISPGPHNQNRCRQETTYPDSTRLLQRSGNRMDGDHLTPDIPRGSPRITHPKGSDMQGVPECPGLRGRGPICRT